MGMGRVARSRLAEPYAVLRGAPLKSTTAPGTKLVPPTKRKKVSVPAWMRFGEMAAREAKVRVIDSGCEMTLVVGSAT